MDDKQTHFWALFLNREHTPGEGLDALRAQDQVAAALTIGVRVRSLAGALVELVELVEAEPGDVARVGKHGARIFRVGVRMDARVVCGAPTGLVGTHGFNAV